MAYPRIKLADNSGNEVAVTSNALDVNIAGGSASIAIGDVDLMLDGGVPLLGNAGAVAAGVLRVTLASDDPAVVDLAAMEVLLGTIDIDTGSIAGTTNGIGNIPNVIGTSGLTGPTKAISVAGTRSGGGFQELLVDSDGNLQIDVVSGTVDLGSTDNAVLDSIVTNTTDMPNVIGTDGSTGPSKCISIGGTESDGTLQEIRVDELGRLQIELAVFEPGATGAAACLAKIDSETYDTASAGIMSKVVCSTTLGALTNVGDGEITSLQVNGDGALYVDGSDSTQPISGTVTVNTISGFATSSGQLAAGHTIDCNSSNVQLKDGSGTALTSNSGKLDVCLHSEDGTAITETSGFLNVSIRSGSGINTIGNGASAYVVSSGMEYAEFDGSALPFNGNIGTEGETTPMQGSQYGVQYIMPVNENGSKSPIDQTSGQMITTHGITGLASDDNHDVGTSAEKISGADGDVSCHRVDIMAHPSNTGYIWIGDNAVSVDGLNGGIRLAAGDFYSMDIDNTGDVYAIATVDGENVCFNYFT